MGGVSTVGLFTTTGPAHLGSSAFLESICRYLDTKKPHWIPPAGFFVTRQRPSFPLPHGSSIIGLGGLNFRVRDGNGWDPPDPNCVALIVDASHRLWA